ncbi:conserved hypothetical protein [Ricinus communis]|uniref:PB1-like domain-containing protein n=1 Tax=Ricinus communis TaxID=3988 RepID=B9SLV7_RICCO|nr:conserved hypothetical protein [Ricinus communis]
MAKSEKVYANGEIKPKHGIDPDRFGYLSLEDEVKKLGYNGWDKLTYRVPVAMLEYVSKGHGMINLFVEGGRVVQKIMPINNEIMVGNIANIVNEVEEIKLKGEYEGVDVNVALESKEKALVRSGYGVRVFEETGNIYTRSTTRGGRSRRGDGGVRGGRTS